MRSFPILFLQLIMLVWVSPATSENLSLTQIQQIAQSGTPGLALTLLDAQHPGTTKGHSEWFRWSQARTEILVAWKAWSRADEHLRQLPDDLPDPLRRWAQSQRAWLLLEQGEASAARKLLRELVWTVGGRAQDPTEAALWRRLIIRSYLVEDRIADAATAMHRYQQDYASTQPQWLQLRARILLRQRRPGIVLELAPESLQKVPLTMQQLAHLRSGQSEPLVVQGEALAQAGDETLSMAERARFWKVAAEAALLRNDFVGAIDALEQAVLLSPNLPVSDALFHVEVDDLWGIYQRYGEQVSNHQQLLVGDDVAWATAVQHAREKQAFRQGKGLLVMMSKVATSATRREQALVQLADVLREQNNGEQLVEQLFLRSTQFADWSQIPAPVRSQLVEHALLRNDLALASELLASLESQVEKAGFHDNLRRARVMVMGGRVEAGAAALDKLLGEQLFIEPEQLDQLMQVLFDLQAAEHHHLALRVFSRLEDERQLPAERRRELFFWMAESFEATRQYAKSALYFMRSATYTDPGGNDLWGQSARYRAAEVLTRAGLTSDARRLYEALLKITEDDARRSVLRGKLQKLWVLPGDAGDIKN